MKKAPKTAKAKTLALLALAYSYIRFSHPDQAKGDSLRRQTELRDAWLARNKVTLDTSLTLEDKGISGYTGEHRDNPDRHALAAFLYAVEHDRIPRGSYLIVESLDRLSREDILPALTLVLNLIQSGIRIVQLLPVEMVYDENANPMHLMMMIMELSRGHSESALKSERVGEAWQEKKRRASAGEAQKPSQAMREGQRALTARTPAWLRVVDGKCEVIPEAKAALRRVLELARLQGIGAVVKCLNAEGLRPIGRHKRASKHWTRSYVAKLLCDRRLIGEYQPYTGRGKKRAKDGDPVPGYYPAVWTEDEFYAARGAVNDRKGKPGRPSKERVNVFAGLLHDARDGGSLQQANKGKKGGGRLLVSYNAVQGVEGSRFVSFPFATFERAVLSCLREIDPKDVLPQDDAGEDEAQALAGRWAELEAEIEKLKARLQARYSDAVADVLERHEDERKALGEQLEEARRKAASPLGVAWEECQSLLDALGSAPDPEEARLRLRARLRQIAEGFWCLFVARGSWRLAAVQVWFTGGAHRDYVILHRPGTGGAVGARPARWWVRSLADVAKLGPLDLRKREDARRLEAFLLTLDLDGLAG
jgi:DNA invertase Pin-like site-specific DNA recombinase